MENFDNMPRLVEIGAGWDIVPYYFAEECLRDGILAVPSEPHEPGGIDTKVHRHYNITSESERSLLRSLENAR